MARIIKKETLGLGIYSIVVSSPLIARKAEAGQFVIVRLSETGERIPLTISDFNRQEGTITVVFLEAGKTTRLLGAMEEGEDILDLLGPQGNPTEIGSFGNVILIGGGIGVAPVYPLARALKEKGNRVIALLGYRNKEYVFWHEKIGSVSDKVLVATDDGSYGKKGLVTDMLRELAVGREKIDKIFAIGPTPMMKAVVDLAREMNISTVVSLNSLMVCGMGMCGACRVTIAGKVKFTCMDGPDFQGDLVDFDELMQRLNAYSHEERSS